MSFWLFSSRDVDNIKVARDRLLWGFWDKSIGDKEEWDWRSFRKLYDEIKPFDIVFFQIAKTGEIHALGIVKKTFYEDETLIWPDEINQGRVLFPWKVSFAVIIFSEEPLTSYFLKREKYVGGYGIGELSEPEFRNILIPILRKVNVNISVG